MELRYKTMMLALGVLLGTAVLHSDLRASEEEVSQKISKSLLGSLQSAAYKGLVQSSAFIGGATESICDIITFPYNFVNWVAGALGYDSAFEYSVSPDYFEGLCRSNLRILHAALDAKSKGTGIPHDVFCRHSQESKNFDVGVVVFHHLQKDLTQNVVINPLLSLNGYKKEGGFISSSKALILAYGISLYIAKQSIQLPQYHYYIKELTQEEIQAKIAETESLLVTSKYGKKAFWIALIARAVMLVTAP